MCSNNDTLLDFRSGRMLRSIGERSFIVTASHYALTVTIRKSRKFIFFASDVNTCQVFFRERYSILLLCCVVATQVQFYFRFSHFARKQPSFLWRKLYVVFYFIFIFFSLKVSNMSVVNSLNFKTSVFEKMKKGKRCLMWTKSLNDSLNAL